LTKDATHVVDVNITTASNLYSHLYSLYNIGSNGNVKIMIEVCSNYAHKRLQIRLPSRLYVQSLM